MTRWDLEDEARAFFVDDVLAELFEPFADVAVDPSSFVFGVDPLDEGEEALAREETRGDFFFGSFFGVVFFTDMFFYLRFLCWQLTFHANRTATKRKLGFFRLARHTSAIFYHAFEGSR